MGPYGENIYWGFGVGFIDAVAAVRSWVDEEKEYYDYNTIFFFFFNDVSKFVTSYDMSSIQLNT